MQVTAVVVHFTDEARTHRCVASLRAQREVSLRTVLVDHSPGGLRQSLDAELVVRPETNGGFGAGVNAGWEAAPGEVLLLLNPDAVAEPPWAQAMVQALAESPRTGMAACRVAHSDTGRLDSAGMGLSRGGLGILRGHGDSLERDAQALNAPLLGPAGSAAAYKAELLRELGGFPTVYFLYYEDLEVAFRARRLGWDCAWVDEPLARHEHVSSAGGRKTYYLRRAQRLFLKRNWPEVWSRRYRSYLWAALAGAHVRGLRNGTWSQVQEGHREAARIPVTPFNDPLPAETWLAPRP